MNPKLRVRQWLIFSLPVGLALGWWLCRQTPGATPPLIQIDRGQAIERARAFVASQGAEVPAGEPVAVHVEQDVPALRLATERKGAGGVLPLMAPPGVVKVRLGRAGETGGVTCEVSLDLEGRVLGYRLPESAPVADPTARAGAFFAQFPRLAPGAPVVREGAGTVSFSFADPALEEVRHRLTAGPRTLQIEHTLPDNLTKRGEARSRLEKGLAEAAKLVLLVTVIYAMRRFMRRRRERELPIRRAVLLLVAMAALGAASYVLDGDRLPATAGTLGWGFIHPQVIIGAAGAFLYASGGLLLGGAYAATEGDLRMGYRGKLLALDSILSGRPLTRQAGQALIEGCAIGILCFAGAAAYWAVTRQWLGSVAPQLIAESFSRAPVLSHLADIPLAAVWATVSGLLLPLAFLHRHRRFWKVGWAGLVTLPFVVTCGLTQHSLQAGGAIVYALLDAVGLVVAFRLTGLAGALATTLMFRFLVEGQVLSALHGGGHSWWSAGLAIAGMAPFAWAAFRGESVTDEDVRPEYAGRLAQRMELRAKVEAAREAQVRLMPATTPTVPGWSVSVACYPAGIVGGDFYDAFSAGDGRSALLAVSGAGPGLPAALNIALAKGFFRCARDGTAHPAVPVRNFLSEFGVILGATARAEAGVALLFVDPARGRIEAARAGRYPLVWLRRRTGFVETVQWEADSGVSSAIIEPLPGDVVLVHTRGFTEALDDQTLEGQRQWLTRAAENLVEVTPGTVEAAVLDRLWGKKRKGPPADLAADVTLLTLSREEFR